MLYLAMDLTFHFSPITYSEKTQLLNLLFKPPPLGFVIADQCLVIEPVDLDVFVGREVSPEKSNIDANELSLRKCSSMPDGGFVGWSNGSQFRERVAPDAKARDRRLIWPDCKADRFQRFDDAPK